MTHHGRRRPQRLELAALAAILLLTAALPAVHLGRKSVWVDEAYTAFIASVDWGWFVSSIGSREPNMALYYLLMRGWRVFGDSEVALRSLSVVFGVASVGAVYLLGRRLFRSPAGLTAAMLLAVNPFFVRYAQEARSYTLTIWLVTLAALALTQLLRRPSWKTAGAYGVTAGLAPYAHLFTLLVLGAQLLSVPAARLRRWPIRYIAASCLGAVIVASPLLVFVLFHPGYLTWVAPPTPGALLNFAVASAGGRALLVVYVLCCLTALAGALRERGNGAEAALGGAWRYKFLSFWLVLPVAFAYAVSFIQPVFVARYLIVCLPALVLLAAAGLVRLPRRWMQAAGVFLIAGLSVRPVVWHYEQGFTQDWRGIVRYVMADAREDDALVIFTEYLRYPFDYYRLRVAPRKAAPETVHPPVDDMSGIRLAILDGLPSRYERVWLVSGHLNTPKDVATASEIHRILAAAYGPPREDSFTGRIKVTLYGGRPSRPPP